MADIRELRTSSKRPSEPGRTFGLLGLVGKSPQMQELFTLVKKVARSDATVLIPGETGVGKECFARALHMLCSRRRSVFLAFNCSAVPEGLLESQLFGHVRGAFTGASATHDGMFREAKGGMVLLDEIGELPWQLQAKLLRVLEEKEVLPLGAPRSRTIDVRIVAATNRDLLQRVQHRRFREDLYYRLNAVHIAVPPLRERIEDLPDLVRFLIRRQNGILESSYKGVTAQVLKQLSSRVWPGNVRELDNVLGKAMIVGDGHKIQLQDLETAPERSLVITNRNLNKALRVFEKHHIERVLAEMKGDKERCAKALGISRSSLYEKLVALRITVKKPKIRHLGRGS